MKVWEERKKSMQIRRKMPRRIMAVLLVIVLAGAMFLSGCAGTKTAENHGSSGAAAQSETAGSEKSGRKTTTFTDDCGRKVKVPAKIDTVIASGSLAQLFIYALAPDTLQAVNARWSADAKAYIPKKYLSLGQVGSFFGNHDLNYEQIARMKPDVVIDVGEAKPSMKSDLADITDKTGIPAVHIDANFDDMDKAFTKLGRLLGKTEDAKALADYCSDSFAMVKRGMKNVKTKKKVMYCTQEDGMNVLARHAYHSQVIDMLSDNVAVLADPSSKGSGNEVNMEQMMNWNPEVILFAPDSYYDYAGSDSARKTLPAIRKGSYYEVPSGLYNWMGSPPSCNRILGLLWMAKLLYPSQMDYSLKAQVKTYYDLFYHCDLSDGRYKKLVQHSILK